MKYLVAVLSLTLLTLPLSSIVKAKAKLPLGSLFKSGRGVRAIHSTGYGSTKSYDENTLKPEQLKQCVLLGNQLDESEKIIAEQNIKVDAQVNLLSSMESEVNNLDNYLKSNRKTKFTSQAEVDAFNKVVKKFNDIVSRYNLELDRYKGFEAPYNQKINTHNAIVDRFQSECAGKSYYMDDWSGNILDLKNI